MTPSRRTLLRSTCASALLGLAALLAGCAQLPVAPAGEATRTPSGPAVERIHCPPACPHSVLRAEVVCDSCGQPVRHELRTNAGAR